MPFTLLGLDELSPYKETRNCVIDKDLQTGILKNSSGYAEDNDEDVVEEDDDHEAVEVAT